MKDPAVLFYFNDWIGGTITLSRHLKGCYMDLLHAQFNSGHLSLEEIRTVLGQDQANWTVLSKKFKQDENGLFYNVRLDTEMNKRKAFSDSRRKNVSKRYEKEEKATYVDTHVEHMNLHMENEIENENRIEVEKGGMGEKTKIPISEIVDLYNQTCISLAKVQLVSNSRKTKVNARWNELKTIENFKELFEKTQKSPFLIGDNPQGWKATFDWLMENEKNWVKVLEGNYDKNKTNGTTTANRHTAKSPATTDEQFLSAIANGLTRANGN